MSQLMKDLSTLVPLYNFKNDKKLKKICSPLEQHLNIPLFAYFKVDSEGRFANLANHPDLVEFWYGEKLYLAHPYLKDPSLLRSGWVTTTIGFDQKTSDIILSTFGVKDDLIFIERFEDTLEAFFFTPKASDPVQLTDLISKLELLRKFAKYFKRETADLLGKMMSEGLNLKRAKGDFFSEDDKTVPLSFSCDNINKFNQAISPLTAREKECLNLFQRGKSAQATAAILGISRRTVEHYFDNIKAKLDCNSKWDLLDI